jgi:RPA family protein
MSPQSTYKREPAKRMLALELNTATEQIKSIEKNGFNTTGYIITSTGEHVNRVMVCGTLLETTSKSDDFVHMKIYDPTGTIFASSGKYNQEMTSKLINMKNNVPCRFVLIGKPKLIQSEKFEDPLTSINQIESFRIIDEETYRYILSDIVNHTINRLDNNDKITSDQARTYETAIDEVLEQIAEPSNTENHTEDITESKENVILDEDIFDIIEENAVEGATADYVIAEKLDMDIDDLTDRLKQMNGNGLIYKDGLARIKTTFMSASEMV